MKIEIHPSQYSGRFIAPASKSMMQRACAAALLRKGKSVIHNPGKSKDSNAAISVIQKLGAEVEYDDHSIIINSAVISSTSNHIHCGESGLCIRMFTPIAALSDKRIIMDGEGSLLTRSMKIYDDILPLLDVATQSNNGKLPISIKGPLQPKDIIIDGSSGSQFLTGLIMAYSSLNIDFEKTITVENLKSKPYIDLTLSVINAFGLNVPVNYGYQKFTFSPFKQETDLNNTIQFLIEGDWSGAAFLLVAAAIGGEMVLKGIDTSSKQADIAILSVLADCGANMSISADEIKISQSDLKSFEFDATDCPDLFPPLVALAAYCNGKSFIKGVSRLSDKESDRGLTLHQEFGKLGVDILIESDMMIIDGGKEINGAEINSHNDHRIAMACAVASLKAKGSVIINQAECIEKSYPDFYKDLISAGVSIQFH